jgi:hypothetical protein
MSGGGANKLFGLVFLLIFGLVFSGAGYAAAFHWGRPVLQKAEASKSWPSTLGVVEVSDVDVSRDDDGTTYAADVVYVYRVGDHEYRGAEIQAGGSVRSSSRSSALKVVNRYPVGTDVAVYYDPADPTEAVLQPGESAGGSLAWWMGLVFLGVGLSIVIVPAIKLALIALAVGAYATQRTVGGAR